MNLYYRKTRKHGSIFKRVVFFVGLLVVLYSSGWFVLTHLLHGYARGELQQLNEQGTSIECENLRKTGYPLRLGLTCDALRWHDDMRGYALTIGQVITGAPLYAPSWQFVQLRAPAYVDVADFGRIEALWHSLTLTTNITNETLQDLALTVEDTYLTLSERGATPTLLIEADFVHLRIGQEGQRLKATLSFDALGLAGDHDSSPKTTGELVLYLEPHAGGINIWDEGFFQKLQTDSSPLSNDVLAAREDLLLFGLLRGHSGQLEKMELHFSSGGSVMVEGTFDISLTGVLSGQLNVRLLDNAALLRSARGYLPMQDSNLESLFFALNAMPKDAAGNSILTIHIDEGRARLGFIPLGELPSF